MLPMTDRVGFRSKMGWSSKWLHRAPQPGAVVLGEARPAQGKAAAT